MVAHHRLHGLDAVRAFALLTGIVLHATMSFFIPAPVLDNSPSSTLAITCYVIHIFRMTLFFLITGFFARVLLHRYGTRAFAKDRLKRIVVPMVGGWVIFGLPTFAIAHWAGGTSPGPFVHLWFLYYLCIFYVLALTMRAAFNRLIDRHGRIRIAIDTAVRGVTSNYIAPIALASPLFVLLYFSDGWHEWWGIPTPQWHFRPEAFAMVGFGTAFAFGWFVHRQAELLRHWQATWHVHIAIAIGLTAVCLSMVGIAPMSKLTLSGWSRVAYVGCYTGAIWCWTLGLVGAGLYFCSQESPLLRYVADLSYWLYLAHVPLVHFLALMLAEVPLHWAVKFPLILGITLTVSLISYHYWVRPTFIGAMLNGRKYPRKVASHVRVAPRVLASDESV